MHYATKAYNKPDENKVLSWNGSYAHLPHVYEPLSVTKHQVLKTEIKLENIQDKKIDEGANGIIKIMNLKNQQSEEVIREAIRKLYRRHLRIDIKNYLKKIFKKPAHLFPSEGFQSIRIVEGDEKNLGKGLQKTSTLYLYKPFFIMHSLRAVLNKNPEVVPKKNIPNLFHQLISLCLKGGGLDNMLMTTSNVYLSDDCQSLALNYTAFTGLSFLYLKQQTQLQKHEFYQILPYLPSQIFKKSEKKRFDSHLKIRAFVINCLALVVGEDIQIGGSIQNKSIKKVEVEKRLKSQKDTFQKLLKQYKKKINKTLNKIEKKISSSYYGKILKDSLFDRILFSEEKMRWADVLQFFIENDHKVESRIQEYFKQLHKQVWSSEEDKKFYEQRDISDIKLYIPIKFEADLTQIFKYQNWWDVFHDSKVVQEHEDLVYSILKFQIKKVEEDLKGQERSFETLREADPLIDFLLNLFSKNWKKLDQDYMTYMPQNWKQILDL